MNYIDILGYSASIFIVASFLIKNNEKLLRTINLIGCVLFVVYGILDNAIPVVIPNAFLIVVQVYYIFFAKRK
ncbi:uroporphyrinogen decarboxylase [Weeksellaceae bacterium TAE3-ERU29]|nr:uroporphyrinogen decarboxylase [Weeksellaceae bacterium TAE3-ERU29]